PAYDGGSLIGGGGQRDRAAMEFGQALDDRKAEAGAAVLGTARAGLETVEDGGLTLGLDAGAVVGDPQQHVVALAPGAHGDPAAIGAEADRVRQKVVEDLLDPPLVGDKAADARDGLDLQHQAALAQA